MGSIARALHIGMTRFDEAYLQAYADGAIKTDSDVFPHQWVKQSAALLLRVNDNGPTSEPIYQGTAVIDYGMVQNIGGWYLRQNQSLGTVPEVSFTDKVTAQAEGLAAALEGTAPVQAVNNALTAAGNIAVETTGTAGELTTGAWIKIAIVVVGLVALASLFASVRGALPSPKVIA